jgi:hypothetical protein
MYGVLPSELLRLPLAELSLNYLAALKGQPDRGK